jgi:hypothetical protein
VCVNSFRYKILIVKENYKLRTVTSSSAPPLSSIILSRDMNVTIDGFRLMIGFTGLFDRAGDYTLQFTITHTQTHTQVSTVMFSLAVAR